MIKKKKETFVYYSNLFRNRLPILIVSLLMLFASGCVATQDWVQTWVNEQLFPINKRVADNEAGLTQVNGKVANVDARVDTMAKQIADLESRLGQTNAKADLALESLQRLKPERKMVLNFTGGAQFASNSIQFSGQAKKDVDSFLSDLKGSTDDGSNLVFVVAGHTDSSGTPGYNYELSKRRAESIAEYLVAERNVDPTRVMAVGYGERVPLGDNKTEAGRAKNRRVEIMVYRDAISVGNSAATPSPAQAKTR
jgi:outer membrane protein OmpA-like peptidoglycan-associated protein